MSSSKGSGTEAAGGAPGRAVALRAALATHGLLERGRPTTFDDLARVACLATDAAKATVWVGPEERRTEIGRAVAPFAPDHEDPADRADRVDEADQADRAGARDLVVIYRSALLGTDGTPVGGLDLLDVTGRILTPREEQVLAGVVHQAEVVVAEADEWFGDVGVALVDGAGRLIGANVSLERMVGWRLADVEGLDVLSFIHPDDLPGALESFTRTAAFAGPKIPYDLRFRTVTGAWRRLETVADNRLDDPDIQAIVFRLRDAHDRLSEPATLVDQARVLKMIDHGEPLPATLDEIVEMLAARDAHSAVALRASLGEVAGDLGDPADEADPADEGGAGSVSILSTSALMPPALAELVRSGPVAVATQAMARRQAVLEGDLARAGVAGGGALATLGFPAAWSHPIVVGGEVVGSVDVFRTTPGLPTSEAAHHLALAASLASFAIGQHRLHRDREHRARHDALTGLVNRRELNARMAEQFERGAAATDGMAVILIDVDRFQLVNDSLGHHAGDELLVQVARRLEGAIGARGVLARLGGDEYAALLAPTHVAGSGGRDPRDQAVADVDAGTVAFALLDAMAAPFDVAGQRLYITACAGVASTATASEAGELLRHADAALHHAKAMHTGSSCVQVYEPDLGDPALHSFVTEAALRSAIRNEEFLVHYQPVFDLDTAAVVGVEALVRWPQPHLRTMRPDQFIPLAEHTGLIDDIDMIVLRTTCAQIATWNRARATRGDDPIVAWVNVAPEHLLRAGFLASFTDALDAADVPTAWIGIEITERSRLSYDQNSLGTLAALRERGIAIAIDDFGTGYASIGYLDHLPATVLKVDQSFTRKLHEPRTHATVRCILDLARTFEMTVVAEGVETADQRDLLAELGCHHAQGFHLAVPQPAAELDALIAPGPSVAAGA